MISLVVPTRNRAHTLRLVAESYYRQASVTEIIFVNDAGSDNTGSLVQELARRFPNVETRIISNPMRLGASQARNIGVAIAKNDYVLFCDDDEYLESTYAEKCLTKLVESGAGAVSGRRVYLREGETIEQALSRFGKGLRRSKPFNAILCEYVNGAIFEEDIEIPITNAVIITKKSLLRRFPFDGYYTRGNQYREETDYQMNLFVNGYRILVTNACHSIHLPPSMVRSGGQSSDRLRRIYWSIFYTNYFFRKYYDRYAQRMRVSTPRWVALTLFSIFVVYRELARPLAYPIALAAAQWLRGTRSRPISSG